jgi:hypothetical protein
MSDVFSRQQNQIEKARAIGKLDAFGEPKHVLPCSNMATYKLEDCQTCPHPCDEQEQPKQTMRNTFE